MTAKGVLAKLRCFAKGLRFRLLIASLMVELLMMVLLVGNSLRLIDENLMNQAERRILAIELAYKTAVAVPMIGRDYATLRDVLDGLRQGTDITYIVVTDPSGVVLAASGVPAAPVHAAPHSADVRDVQFSVDVMGQLYGDVHYGLSMAFLKSARHQLLVQGTVIAGVALLLSFLLLYAVGYWLTRHLAHLAQASERIAQGSYGIRLKEASQDEVGQLTHNFNLMAEAVQTRVSELADHLARQKVILQALGEGIYGLDKGGRCTFINPAALSMLGYTEAEIVGANTHKLFHHSHPDGSDYPHATCPVYLTQHDGQLRKLEDWLWRKDGQGFPVSMIITPMWMNGELQGSVVSFWDITASRQAALAVKDSLEQLSAFIHALPDIVVIKDGQSRWQLMNQAAEDALALKDFAWQGKSNADLAHERPNYRAFHEEADASDKLAWESADVSLSIEHIHAEGSPPRICEVRKIPVFAKDGSHKALMVIARDITEQQQTKAHIHRLAYTDNLTGLANRALLFEHLEMVIANGKRLGTDGALMLLNLDRFKNLNDARGHRLGDLFLVAVGERLLNLLDARDTLARLSADEFAILVALPDAPGQTANRHALALAEQIHSALRQPFVFGDEVSLITASLGITLCPQDADDTPQEVLRRADTALHRAKHAGGNQSAFFDVSMGELTQQRFRTENELRQGIAAGELRLFIQPQVDASGKLVSSEALVRWQHPERGLLAPGAFIPIAEESDLIIELENWVMREVCRHLAREEMAGYPLHMSVNISPRHFRQSGFVNWLIELLAQAGNDPAYLTLEITEGMVIDNIDELIAKMNRLSKMGIHFSIDDFGTGYSSLAYLKRLPIDELKIDKTFVQDAPTDPDDGALVQTILSIARNLHLKVVAEGVETEEQAHFLNERADVIHQGYLFGRPEPADSFLKRRHQTA